MTPGVLHAGRPRADAAARVRAALLALVLALCAAGAAWAADDAGLPPPPRVEMRDGAGPSARGAGELRGNPLWAVPVEALSETRERPLFTPSRRAPPTVGTAPPPPPAAPAPPAPPARPRLSLMGTVVSPAGGFGIFTDPSSNAVVRLRIGEVHEGWTLRTVSLRSVEFSGGAGSVVLALPPRNAPGPAAAPGRGAEGPFAAARPGAANAPSPRIVTPRRPPPSPSDLDSSH